MSDFSDSEFQGKGSAAAVAAVTGAGGGIGRCHAIEFAKRGAKVVVYERSRRLCRWNRIR